MNAQEMTNIVREDLTHIPKGYGVTHGLLRYYYNMIRRRDLSKGNITKEKTLAHCIKEIKKDNPNWNPEYDIEYFKMDTITEKNC